MSTYSMSSVSTISRKCDQAGDLHPGGARGKLAADRLDDDGAGISPLGTNARDAKAAQSDTWSALGEASVPAIFGSAHVAREIRAAALRRAWRLHEGNKSRVETSRLVRVAG